MFQEERSIQPSSPPPQALRGRGGDSQGYRVLGLIERKWNFRFWLLWVWFFFLFEVGGACFILMYSYNYTWISKCGKCGCIHIFWVLGFFIFYHFGLLPFPLCDSHLPLSQPVPPQVTQISILVCVLPFFLLIYCATYLHLLRISP